MKLSGLENTTKGLREVKTQIETQIETLKNDINNIDASIVTKLEEIEALKQSKYAKMNSCDAKEKDLEQLNLAISSLDEEAITELDGAISSLEELSGENVVNKAVSEGVQEPSVQEVEEE